MITNIFTFGFGQGHDNGYVIVHGEDEADCRQKMIDEFGILQGEENRGAKAVLQAAAWTYVATALYAVLNFIQLFLATQRD